MEIKKITHHESTKVSLPGKYETQQIDVTVTAELEGSDDSKESGEKIKERCKELLSNRVQEVRRDIREEKQSKSVER